MLIVMACLATQCLHTECLRVWVKGYGHNSTIDGLLGLVLLVCQAEGTRVGGVRHPDPLASFPLPPNAPDTAAGNGARARSYDATAPGRWPLPRAAQQTPPPPGASGSGNVLVGGALCLQSWVGGGTWWELPPTAWSTHADGIITCCLFMFGFSLACASFAL